MSNYPHSYSKTGDDMARTSRYESIESRTESSHGASEKVRSIKSAREGHARRASRNPKKGWIIILLAMVAVIVFCAVRTKNLKEKSDDMQLIEHQLETQITEEERRSEELKNQENYMQTNRYVEEEARKKLSLVYPDEIVIRPAEEK